MKSKQKPNQRILVIDNIDSFVYNLVQYIGEQGAEVFVLDNTSSMAEVDKLIKEKHIDKIVISPGPKRPEDAGISKEIIKKYGPKMPILGVCLGHQCIGYVYGGVIRRARTLKHGKTSLIEHDGSGLLKGLPSPLEAIRYHSLVIDDKTAPESLDVIAKSQDDNEIMAVKHKQFPVYGLQFHPESILTGDGKAIIRNFLKL